MASVWRGSPSIRNCTMGKSDCWTATPTTEPFLTGIFRIRSVPLESGLSVNIAKTERTALFWLSRGNERWIYIHNLFRTYLLLVLPVHYKIFDPSWLPRQTSFRMRFPCHRRVFQRDIPTADSNNERMRQMIKKFARAKAKKSSHPTTYVGCILFYRCSH